MKRFNFYLSLMLLLVFTAACSDEFDQPPMVIPTAEHTPNMTIAEFKAKHWQDDRNYIDTIKDDEVIHGWITSSDEEGNIYKQLYISDGTAGLTVSIDQSSIYTKYRIGQEVVIPMKGYFIGKFNGLLCLGVPYWYAAQGVWESNRMPMEMWDAMAEINGLPDVSKVDTTIIELSETPVYTINTGTWYSMALLIGIAGHKRFATSRSTFLLHDGINGYMDSQSKAEDYADFIKKFNSLVVKEYVMGNSAITSEEYEENRRVEWYFLASEAKEKELVDAIIGVDEGYDIYDIC